MTGYYILLEAYHSLKTHKIRTCFTGFGIMWAMVILILLHGGGSGFYNGTLKNFSPYSIPTITITSGYTSLARNTPLTEDLVDKLAYHIDALACVVPVFQTKSPVAYAEKTARTLLLGVGIGYSDIAGLVFLEGRFFTQHDLEQRLPVCIVDTSIKNKLFGGARATGKLISLGGTTVAIIGVCEATSWGGKIWIPATLFKGLLPLQSSAVAEIIATLKPKQAVAHTRHKIRDYLARQLEIGTQDQENTLSISSNDSHQSNAYQILFLLIWGFIKLVSLCLLVSGVIGVGNIMLVTVKERSQEIAIRKILGAQSRDILTLILLEAMVITLISGILGIGIGMVLIRGVNHYLTPCMLKHGIAHCEVQLSVIAEALGLLGLSGCLASIIPIKKALCSTPVAALNNYE